MAQIEPEVSTRLISLRLACRPVRSGRWTADRWLILGIATSASTPETRPVLIDHLVTAEGGEYLWDGLPLTLYPDETAHYQFNLTAETPLLFVICAQDEISGTMQPAVLTLSQDEAASALEVDDEVISVPLPGDIRQWAEAYVERVGIPEPKKRRKACDV